MPFKVKKIQPREYKRIVIAGLGGMGKTTAAIQMFKNPIVFDLENRVPAELINTKDIDVPEYPLDFRFMLKALDDIKNEPNIKNDGIVIDTGTELERIAEKYSITVDFEGKKGKYLSYTNGPKNFLPVHLKEFLRKMDEIQEKHKIHCVFVCHVKSKSWSNPQGEDFMKYVLALYNDVAPVLFNWADYVGHVYDDYETKKDGLKNKVSKANRVITFNNMPYFDSKNSGIPLPDKIDFDIETKWAKQILEGEKNNANA